MAMKRAAPMRVYVTKAVLLFFFKEVTSFFLGVVLVCL